MIVFPEIFIYLISKKARVLLWEFFFINISSDGIFVYVPKVLPLRRHDLEDESGSVLLEVYGEVPADMPV